MSRAPRGRRAAVGRPPVDPVPQEVAAVQGVLRDWAVMWSPWRRAFTAFARFGGEPLIIDEPDKMRFLQRCHAAELAAAHGRAVET